MGSPHGLDHWVRGRAAVARVQVDVVVVVEGGERLAGEGCVAGDECLLPGERTCSCIIAAPCRTEAWPGSAAGGAGYAARRAGSRSEERRVGKECRSRWSP